MEGDKLIELVSRGLLPTVPTPSSFFLLHIILDLKNISKLVFPMNLLHEKEQI